MKPIWKQDHGGEGNELWLGVPTWDPDNRDGQLSIKYAYRVNGRIPRTAPEIPERLITPMLLMLGKHGRLKPEEVDQIEQLVNRVRGKTPPGNARLIGEKREGRAGAR